MGMLGHQASYRRLFPLARLACQIVEIRADRPLRHHLLSASRPADYESITPNGSGDGYVDLSSCGRVVCCRRYGWSDCPPGTQGSGGASLGPFAVAGSVICTSSPPSGLAWASAWPLCALATDATMDRPSPEPGWLPVRPERRRNG